ncbi:N-acetylneuraminate synthase [Magnetospirillum fulvum]|uniref:N-acylneuraminate-9-phosphate synthase n=1 Tax=Magnetospirillum fulvum MGU-K5 TaxID=1316936 RepID=S9SAK8_MAGFU|nr:N-acetylneuraminate synthase [Magnetospirillum fulvum]EPY01729.1 N-acylneuraminate-9-phosphate synthase [Magnetospirillum fulvum MGU-K5]
MSVMIIAEAGVNHNGDPELAKRLIDAAKAAGADYVKFQTFKAERLVTQGAAKADYQKKTSGADESQFEMIRRLELSEATHRDLIAHCAAQGIGFLSTGFDVDSLDMLAGLGLPLVKIPSGEITNLPYLRHVGSMELPVVLSTGMATLAEVDDALGVLEDAGLPRDRITVLHCTTEYPTPMDEVNLSAMLTMRDTFGVAVGYSDHTEGIEIAIAATALGACIIEKHFTLDRSLPGPDHKASLEPDELAAMVAAIRNIERAMGDGIKRPGPSETRNLPIARKSIVAARPISAGEPLSAENMTVKRPGSGLSPMRWDDMIGRIADRAYQRDEAIEP